MKRFSKIWPSIVVLTVVVALWWLAVVLTHSVIFPTPGKVVLGTLELARDGTLWEHIGASLFRVGAGFLLAVLFAIPLGLWMGWVHGAYVTLNPLFQILRPISPIAWIPIAILWFGVGNASPIYLIFIASVFPNDRADHHRRAHHRKALPAGRGKLWCVAPQSCSCGWCSRRPCRRSSSACASDSASRGWWWWRPR
jgi:ABC-type proline/glycine betaine transport system permease subunit